MGRAFKTLPACRATHAITRQN